MRAAAARAAKHAAARAEVAQAAWDALARDALAQAEVALPDARTAAALADLRAAARAATLAANQAAARAVEAREAFMPYRRRVLVGSGGRVVLAPLAFLAAVLLGRWASGHRRVAGWIVWCAVGVLPSVRRDRYRDEFLAELDYLETKREPMLGVALGMLATALATRVALQANAWAASATARRLGRLEPLWTGLVTAVSVFAAIAAGWAWRQGQPPSRLQLAWASLAALAAGSLATWQTWKTRPRGGQQPGNRRSRLP